MNRLILQDVLLIRGTGDAAEEHVDIIIEDRLIKQITPTGILNLENAETVQLSGMTVLPGLINSHVHITFEPVGDPLALIASESRTRTVLRAVANLEKQLDSGVTYFRDLGAPDYIDLELRDCVRKGVIKGPDFLACGRSISMTGGHGHQMSRECDGADDARKAAREQLKAGADVIKLMATGGVMTAGVEPGSPQLTRAEMSAAVNEAHKAGRKTAAHAQGTRGIKNALLAGIDSIEHGIFLDDQTLDLMYQKGTYLVPTLVAPYLIVKHGVEAGIPQFAVEKSKQVMNHHQHSFYRAAEAGIKIAMGTDAGTPFNGHDGAAHEIKLMVEYGMTPMEAIIASTKTAAELLGIEDLVGTITEGKVADLIVVSDNPLQNIDTLFDVRQVYKAGKPQK